MSYVPLFSHRYLIDFLPSIYWESHELGDPLDNLKKKIQAMVNKNYEYNSINSQVASFDRRHMLITLKNRMEYRVAAEFKISGDILQIKPDDYIVIISDEKTIQSGVLIYILDELNRIKYYFIGVSADYKYMAKEERRKRYFSSIINNRNLEISKKRILDEEQVA